LIFLAPFIAEVLSGATRISFIFVLLPEMMVWGGGALLCRELVRRWQAGATSLLMLGLALSIAEEFIIQQTSIAPLPWPGANANYGRIWGINWIYFLFMLGFESIFVVLVPVQVTELLFPSRRKQPWLRTRGIIVTCIAFLVGCRIAWYGWTQQALKRMNIAPYHPPSLTIALGFATIALLILLAYLLRETGHSGVVSSRRPAHPWIIGIAAFVFCAPWWVLMSLVFVPRPGLPVWIPMASGIGWALMAFTTIRFLSAAQGWNDTHRWTLSFGATLLSMSSAYISTAGWLQIDLMGKAILNVLAVIGFLLLARNVWRRTDPEQLPKLQSPGCECGLNSDL